MATSCARQTKISKENITRGRDTQPRPAGEDDVGLQWYKRTGCCRRIISRVDTERGGKSEEDHQHHDADTPLELFLHCPPQILYGTNDEGSTCDAGHLFFNQTPAVETHDFEIYIIIDVCNMSCFPDIPVRTARRFYSQLLFLLL